MNSLQRKAVREGLANAGMHRKLATYDPGNGMYVEEWGTSNSNDEVRISWGPRDPDPDLSVHYHASPGGDRPCTVIHDVPQPHGGT